MTLNKNAMLRCYPVTPFCLFLILVDSFLLIS